jgi:cytochrome c-type biogenesis protein CcmH/NrfG
MYQRIVAKFNNISFTIITGICALLPLFFLPATVSGLGAVKGAVLYIGVLLAFSFWVVAQFIEGNLRASKNWVLGALLLWVILSLASALASANTHLSLWGRGFALDAFSTTLMLGLFAFMVSSFAREQRKLIKLFLAAFAGSVATILLQVIFFAAHNVPFVSKYLGHVASQGTLVGSWVDFAYFVTLIFILSLLMFEVLMPKGFFKFLSAFSMGLSLVVLAFLNFKTAWVIIIVSALLVFVYKSSVERSLAKLFPKAEKDENGEGKPVDGSQPFPMIAFGTLILGLLFFLSSASLGASLARTAGVTFADIRPSFSATTHVMRATLLQDPIFGAGAGRFGTVWNMYHSPAVNQTIFWNTSFDGGYSFVETMATTNGILVVLVFLAMLVLAILHGFKLFNDQYPDRFSRFIAVTSLIMLIAFAGLVLFASPGIVLVTIGFMYLGIMVGVSSLVGRSPLLSFNYLRDPRMSFFAILLLVVAAMVGFSSVYFAANKFASVIVYNRAVLASDFATAERRINRALSISQNDIYWRTRAALYTSQFASTAAGENPDKGLLQTYFTQAQQSAQAAVAWDRGDSTNWLTLSQIYRLIASTSNQDAFNNAKQAADEALARNPNNPAYTLNQAQVALTKQDTAEANRFIDAAIVQKPDYLDAFVLRAQIKASQGNSKGAATEIENYTKAAPFDSQGYVVLGNAHLQLKEYQAALDAFSRARQLAPNNPSIYLSYINTLVLMGQRTQAVAELQKFKQQFPQVQGVDEQIDRVSSGTSTPSPTTEDSKTP